jgi:hypothetical protein
MNGIQCLAPTRLPTADEIGWKMTKVMKNKDTAKFKSPGAAPMSLVNPASHKYVLGRDNWERAWLTLSLSITNITPIETVEKIQQ